MNPTTPRETLNFSCEVWYNFFMLLMNYNLNQKLLPPSVDTLHSNLSTATRGAIFVFEEIRNG